MAPTKSATGFIAQDRLMTYATPQIQHLQRGFDTFEAAREAAGLDWDPRYAPVLDVYGRQISGFKAVHGRDNETISIVTNKHAGIDHSKDMRVVVETVMDTYQEPCDALIELDGGRRVLARVTHGEAEVRWDTSPIRKETWIGLRHDAKGALAVWENAYRTSCTNQLGFISRQGFEAELKVRHTGDTEAKVAALADRLRARADDWRLWEEEMAALHATPVSNQQFFRFTKVFIPEPIPPVSPARALNAQHELMNLFSYYRQDLGDNAYAGYQAITEFEDQVRAARGPVGRFQRAIQPNPNKNKGLRMLVAVAR